MNRDEIDVLWNRALSEAVDAGEIYTRYRFAAFVAAAEREVCAKLLDDNWFRTQAECAAAIRARGKE